MSPNSIPSLINGSAGRPAVAIAGKKSECKGCHVSISKGEKCFDIPNPSTAYGNPRRFCPSCFNEIILKTKADIIKLETM